MHSKTLDLIYSTEKKKKKKRNLNLKKSWYRVPKHSFTTAMVSGDCRPD
jgi:hypothetical protein